MTHEKRKKSPKKKVCMSDFPQCHEARFALLNGDSVDRMAAESSRARLINHVVEEYLPTGREYTSFFRLSLARDPENPSVSLTPPTREPHCELGKRTTEVYPSMLPTVRWLPEETTSVDSSDIPEEKSKYHCRCHQCTSQHCPSQKTSRTEERSVNPRTTIAKFSDCQTMTSNHTDAAAACGISKGVNYSPTMRDAAVVASVTTLSPRVCFEDCAPSPAVYIKRCDKYPRCGILVDLQTPFENEQRAVRDTDEEKYHCSLPSTPIPTPSCKRCTTPRSEVSTACEEPRRGWTDVGRQSVSPTARRMLYNEGITDSETQFLPNKRSPSYHARDMSRERDTNRCYNIDGYIPFSHTNKSRYHKDCKTEHWKRACVTIGPESISSRTAVPYPDARMPAAARACKAGAGMVASACKPCCRPRKLLMSEKDIEAYIQCSWKKHKDTLYN